MGEKRRLFHSPSQWSSLPSRLYEETDKLLYLFLLLSAADPDIRLRDPFPGFSSRRRAGRSSLDRGTYRRNRWFLSSDRGFSWFPGFHDVWSFPPFLLISVPSREDSAFRCSRRLSMNLIAGFRPITRFPNHVSRIAWKVATERGIDGFTFWG